MTETSLVPAEGVEKTILILRGRRVILDSDLAALYGVPVGISTERSSAMPLGSRRTSSSSSPARRTKLLRFQIGISNARRGGRRYLPYAFTEHGAVMAASVLNSPKAVEMSVEVVRAFVRLRGFLAAHHQLAAKLDKLERQIATHDSKIVALFEAVRSLMGTARNDYVIVSGFQGKKPARR